MCVKCERMHRHGGGWVGEKKREGLDGCIVEWVCVSCEYVTIDESIRRYLHAIPLHVSRLGSFCIRERLCGSVYVHTRARAQIFSLSPFV